MCRELRLSFWTAILALFLLAVNGSLIKYAQEVRIQHVDVPVALFDVALCEIFPNRKGNFVLTLVNLILVYTHYFGWLIITTEISAIVLFQRIKWLPITAMTFSYGYWIRSVVRYGFICSEFRLRSFAKHWLDAAAGNTEPCTIVAKFDRAILLHGDKHRHGLNVPDLGPAALDRTDGDCSLFPKGSADDIPVKRTPIYC